MGREIEPAALSREGGLEREREPTERMAQLLEAARGHPELLEAILGASPQLAHLVESAAALEPAHLAGPPSAIESKEEGFDQPKRHTSLQEELIDPDESYSDFLLQIWQVAARAVEGMAGRLQNLPLDENPYLQSIRLRFAPRDFYSDELEVGAEAGVSGLIGSSEDVMLQVRHLATQIGEDRAELRKFLAGPLAATIERMERDGVGSPERRSDLVLLPLTQALAARPAPCRDSQRKFMAGVRGYLENQPAEDRQSGYFLSRAAIGDLLNSMREPECLMLSVFYYHEVLVHYFRLVEETPERFQPPDQRRVKAVANNTSNLLENIRRVRGLPDNPRLLALRGDLMRLSVTMGTNEDEIERNELARLGELLERLLQVDEVHPPLGLVLDDMMRSSSAWEMDSFLQLGFMEAAAAVVRVALPSRRIEGPPLFFNAGVSLLRQEPKWNEELFSRGRAVMCAIGLWWSFEGNLGRPEVALLGFGGLSCALNMFSAATDIEWSEQDRSVLGRLAGTLMALRSPQLPQDAQIQFLRLEGSLRDLRLDSAEPALDGLLADVDHVIGSLLGKPEGVPRLVSTEPLATAILVREVFESLIEPPQSAQQALVDPVVELLSTIVEQRQQPAEVLLSLYRGCMGASPGEPDPGPLVAVGYLEIGEWELVAGRAMEPQESLAELLRAPGRLDWLLQ